MTVCKLNYLSTDTPSPLPRLLGLLSVDAAQLADDAVTTVKIIDDAITSAKITWLANSQEFLK